MMAAAMLPVVAQGVHSREGRGQIDHVGCLYQGGGAWAGADCAADLCLELPCKAEQGRCRLAWELQSPACCKGHLQRDRHLQWAYSITAKD